MSVEADTRTDVSNWRTPPFGRWAFHHVREVLPVADIAAGDTPRALPPSRASLDGFSLTGRDGATLTLEQALAATASDAMVVLKDGAVVFEAYAHGMTADTPHIWMSATKSLTGLISGLLAADGVLDLQAPVSAYLAELAGTAYADAPLQALIDMRAGVRLDGAQEPVYRGAAGWDPLIPGAPGDLHSFFPTLPPQAVVHDGPFAYISANTDLMAWVVERATGESFAEVVSRRLWAQMGAEHAAAITLDPSGAARAAGGMCSTARDFARLGQLIVDGGVHDGRTVIPSAVLDGVAETGDAQAWANGEWGHFFGFVGAPMCYRSGWYVVDSDPQHLFAMGIHGQNLFVDRARRVVIAKFSSLDQPIDYPALVLTHRMADEIRRLLA